MIEAKLLQELDEAEAKAIDALARYKFWMFGYWAAIWVHQNRILGARRPSPFKRLVELARELRNARSVSGLQVEKLEEKNDFDPAYKVTEPKKIWFNIEGFGLFLRRFVEKDGELTPLR